MSFHPPLNCTTPMPTDSTPTNLAIGFLTITQSVGSTLGGLLILNSRGRPLEFHCTAPVVPNRSQEILYGRTFLPYLYGEQIGITLLQKARAQPQVVFTDYVDVLAARWHWSDPIALLVNDTGLNDSSGRDPGDMELQSIMPGGQGIDVRVLREFPADAERTCEMLTRMPQFDWHEPFHRLREALEETQRGQAA